MARNQTVTSTTLNIFALSRVKKECYYEPIRVDFCPISKPNQQIQSIIPFFNNDGYFFTPAFILPRQKISVEQNLKSQKHKFEARILHSECSSQDKTPEYKPTDNNYCQLCQQDFSDYWDHINGKYHKRMINTSKFNKDIINLCESLQKINNQQVPAKTKQIEKKRNNNKHNTKTKNIKTEKQQISDGIKNKQSLRTLECQIEEKLSPQEIQRRNIQESLKITLQLGNHSTNLLNSNTFKQFCNKV